MGAGTMGEGGQKGQTSSYNMNKSRGCHLQHGGHSQQHCTACLNTAKKTDLEVFITHKKNL